jgi:hypothetical protein
MSTDDIRPGGEIEPSEHKAYTITPDHNWKEVAASYDTEAEAIEALRSLTFPNRRFDYRYVVRHGRRVIWPKSG